MLHVTTCLWDANAKSLEFSRCYDESWVEKLYRGFARNLTLPFRFVCFTDRPRRFAGKIEQEPLRTPEPGYGCCIEPFRLNVPMIFCGLDTVILGNIDHMARYCLSATDIAIPQHPSKPKVTINPIVFAPAGHAKVFEEWSGQNDMEWMGLQRHVKTDLMWPGQILSFKLHDVRRRGLQRARIVYFHGRPKPPELVETQGWLNQHWR